ncbi:MAG: nuclear transport factor 2 family protein [Gemmatimonadaceae bacterium]
MASGAASTLIDLEKKYWNAMVDKDVDTAVRLSDDPCVISGAQGVSAITNDQYRKLMTNGEWDLNSYEMSDVQARMISEDVAVVAYKVREELTVDGKPLRLEANDSSTWVRRDGSWKCALHTEAVAGDPFGRDKKKK